MNIDSTGRTHKACKQCKCTLPLGEFCLTPTGRFSMYCLSCGIPTPAERTKAWYKQHPEHNERCKQYYQDNKKERQAYQVKWAAENKEKHRASSKRSMAAKPEKYKALAQAYNKEHAEQIKARNKIWYEKNSDLMTAHSSKRRAAKLQAIPLWADLAKIKEFYTLAKYLTASSNTTYVVDHIVPLQGRTVCGLHCEDNLQVITQHDNAVKYNRLD